MEVGTPTMFRPSSATRRPSSSVIVYLTVEPCSQADVHAVENVIARCYTSLGLESFNIHGWSFSPPSIGLFALRRAWLSSPTL